MNHHAYVIAMFLALPASFVVGGLLSQARLSDPNRQALVTLGERAGMGVLEVRRTDGSLAIALEATQGGSVIKLCDAAGATRMLSVVDASGGNEMLICNATGTVVAAIRATSIGGEVVVADRDAHPVCTLTPDRQLAGVLLLEKAGEKRKRVGADD